MAQTFGIGPAKFLQSVKIHTGIRPFHGPKTPSCHPLLGVGLGTQIFLRGVRGDKIIETKIRIFQNFGGALCETPDACTLEDPGTWRIAQGLGPRETDGAIQTRQSVYKGQWRWVPRGQGARWFELIVGLEVD